MVEETKNIVKENTPKESNIKMWAIVGALALMMVFSGVQAMELAGLKETINTGFEGIALQDHDEDNTTSKATDLKNNLASLPSMVGGC